jgi:hypothetical protein
VLVVGDSLAFYGPVRGENSTHPELFPNVMGAALGASADVVARTGWTARDAWWALTRDPLVYSVLLPRASAVVLAVGNMDYLPTVVPTWLREGIRYLRPPSLRRSVRSLHGVAQRRMSAVTPWRALPQRLTDQYLSHCVHGIRFYHPGVPVIGVLPPPHRAPAYGGRCRGHTSAVTAARAWGQRENVPMVDLPALVGTQPAGTDNPDGMHWGWATHEAVGRALASAVSAEWSAGSVAGGSVAGGSVAGGSVAGAAVQ